MTLFLHQLRFEQQIFWRTRDAAFFIFIFPPMLFLLLGSVYDGTIDGLPAADVLLTGMLGYGSANTAFAGLAIILVVRREEAILKRIRGTPMPAATYLGSVLSSMLLVFALQCLVMVGLGIALFDTSLPDRTLPLLAVLLVGTASFAGLGVGLAGLIRSAQGSSAVVNAVLLPMAFLSGSFGPTRDYPRVLQAIGDVLPLKYFIDAVQDVYLRDEGLWSNLGSLAIVAAWGVAGLLVAARRFGWEPRER